MIRSLLTTCIRQTRYLQAQGGPVAAAGKAASTSKDVNPALATQPWDPLTRGKKRKIKTEPETAPRKRSSSSAAPSKSAEPRPLPTHKSSPLPLPEDVEMDVKPDISRLRSAAAAPVSAPSTLAKVPNIKPEPSPGGVVPPLPPRARSPEPMPTIQDLERDFREMQADYGLDAPIEEVIARAGYVARASPLAPLPGMLILRTCAQLRLSRAAVGRAVKHAECATEVGEDGRCRHDIHSQIRPKWR